MSIRKGTRIVRSPEYVLTQRVMKRCLDLQSRDIIPSVRNIGFVGCSTVRLLKIRDQLILEGIISLPQSYLYKSVHDRIRSIAESEDCEVDPTPEEQLEIEARIEKIRQKKMRRNKAVFIKECKLDIKR
jgi:hypothetical protein